VWILTANAVMRGNGTTWTAVLKTDSAYGSGLWVSGPNDVLVGGCNDPSATGTFSHGSICHWDGSSWTVFGTQDNRQVQSFWGSAPSDVWGATASSNGYLGHWDGRAWSHVDSVHAGILAGGAPGDFWIASTTLVHHSASGDVAFVDLKTLGIDTTACSSTSCVHGGWALALNDVWFVADGGRTLHFDGTSWTTIPTPTNSTLRSIWGSSSNDIWAVSDGGTLLHFNGTHWSPTTSPTAGGLAGIWSSGPCDVWAVGDAVYHGAP
jgi:hypothetical protein